MAINWMTIFSMKLRVARTKNEIMILLTVTVQDRSLPLCRQRWLVIVGRNEISIPSHQKKIVAGISSCLPRSRHFLELLVNRLDTKPIGQGISLAASLPAQRVSQTISSHTENHKS